MHTGPFKRQSDRRPPAAAHVRTGMYILGLGMRYLVSHPSPPHPRLAELLMPNGSSRVSLHIQHCPQKYLSINPKKKRQNRREFSSETKLVQPITAVEAEASHMSHVDSCKRTSRTTRSPCMCIYILHRYPTQGEYWSRVFLACQPTPALLVPVAVYLARVIREPPETGD